MNETLTPDLYLLHIGARLSTLSRAWFARPWRARLERAAAQAFRYADEVKRMRVTIDELVEEERCEVYAAYVPPLRVECMAALAELDGVVQRWRDAQ